VLGKLIDQRALARARRAGKAEYPRPSAIREEGLEQL